jgi:hypothetical protein
MDRARRGIAESGVSRIIPKSMSSTTIGDGYRFSGQMMRKVF